MPTDRSPLLHLCPPTADIIPFPTTSRVGKIRRTAELMDGSTGRAACAHWNRAVDGIAGQMTRAGIEPERITAELQAFTHALQAELARRSRGTACFWPDGGDAA